jgi:sn-glycerol 3-phosphate transport system ATP-binding protein
VPRPERKRRIAEIAEKLDLQAMLTRRGAGLNMSEMQRVALGRVLVTEPRLLLLDEPMSNLDAALRAALRGELKLIQRSLGQTVLYVTHDQIEAMSMSDRIAVMRAGHIEQVGTPDDIYHHPATRFVAEFIGDPPINMLPCTVKRSGSRVTAATALHSALALRRSDAPEGEQILGVRPRSAPVEDCYRRSVATTARFIEKLGAEDVVHLDYGDGLAAAIATPGFAVPGERLWLSIDGARAHVIRRDNDRVAMAGAE